FACVADARADDVGALRTELASLPERTASAEAKCAEVARQPAEALHLLQASTRPEQRHGNCAPSRSRPLLTQFQWMQKNGHAERAERTLATAVERIGDDAGRLNSVVWSLITDEETAGEFDGAALALARRMQQAGGLNHQQLDTVALACFLGGFV